MIQDEEGSRLNKVKGLNEKWPTLLTMMAWDMKVVLEQNGFKRVWF